MGAIRKIARGVAKNRMKAGGLVQFCKHGGGVSSPFSKMWRRVVSWNDRT